MVNLGAIATTSLVSGQTLEAKWKILNEQLSRFAGRRLTFAFAAPPKNGVQPGLAVQARIDSLLIRRKAIPIQLTQTFTSFIIHQE